MATNYDWYKAKNAFIGPYKALKNRITGETVLKSWKGEIYESGPETLRLIASKPRFLAALRRHLKQQNRGIAEGEEALVEFKSQDLDGVINLFRLPKTRGAQLRMMKKTQDQRPSAI